MATRSAIALQTPRGLRAVYCHWDGYPSHHLPILEKHYSSARKAAALIAPGDVSCLRTRSTWQSGPTLRDTNGEPLTDSEGNWLSENDRDAQPLYYAERGEKDVAPRRFASLDALLDWADGSGCEHVYTFCAGVGWQHSPVPQPAYEPGPMPGCDSAHW